MLARQCYRRCSPALRCACLASRPPCRTWPFYRVQCLVSLPLSICFHAAGRGTNKGRQHVEQTGMCVLRQWRCAHWNTFSTRGLHGQETGREEEDVSWQTFFIQCSCLPIWSKARQFPPVLHSARSFRVHHKVGSAKVSGVVGVPTDSQA
ncbi:hypothetical protein IWZ01DRAFT_74299 [Phyllosticta capitalensis]